MLAIASALFGRIWGWLLAGIAIITFVKYQNAAAEKRGREQADAQRKLADATAVTSRAKLEREMAGASPDAVSAELRRTLRK